IRPYRAPYLNILKEDIIQTIVNNATFRERQRIEILELQIQKYFPNTEYTKRIQKILDLTITEETIQKNKQEILLLIDQTIIYEEIINNITIKL
ncbi:4109_t:CDS:1, partial [Gigaspora rosea]